MNNRNKLKNIEQANLMIEQSYLKSKGLINESEDLEWLKKVKTDLALGKTLTFNIQLDLIDPENTGKSVLRVWGDSPQDGKRIPITKEDYDDLVDNLKTEYHCNETTPNSQTEHGFKCKKGTESKKVKLH